MVAMKRLRTGEEGGAAEGADAAANVLMLLSHGAAAPRFPGRLFRCKSCSREFASFQALGGHRASHKKPRLGGDKSPEAAAPAKARGHECPICGLEFAMGQALGGHMRRHRGPPVEGFPLAEKKPGASEKSGDRSPSPSLSLSLSLSLDLNLSAPAAGEEVDFCALTLGRGGGLPAVY